MYPTYGLYLLSIIPQKNLNLMFLFTAFSPGPQQTVPSTHLVSSEYAFNGLRNTQTFSLSLKS
jgi:hypothetical protein